MKKPVLVVLHQEHSTPGRVGQTLRQLGHPLDIRRPRFDDPLPDTLGDHAGAVVFGGPMSANDEDDYIREIEWLKVPLREDKPLLGICLGAQMLARHLGGSVYCHADGHVEVGYYRIRPTEAGLAVQASWPDYVYEWHREGFDVPPGAELLAEGDTFSGAGVPFRRERVRNPVPPGGHARHDVPVDNPRRCEAGTAGRQVLAGAFCDRAAYDYAIRSWLAGFLETWVTPARDDRANGRQGVVRRTSLEAAPPV